MYVNEDECEAAGLDPKKVESIARRLSAAGREADKLGITIFGGSSSGSLRIHDKKGPQERALILADIDGYFDGGDGGYKEDDEGLLRGE